MHTPLRRFLFKIASELHVHVREVETYSRDHVLEWLAEFELRAEEYEAAHPKR